MIWVALPLLAFCVVIALAPVEATQTVLAIVWTLMGLAAVALPVLALLRVI